MEIALVVDRCTAEQPPPLASEVLLREATCLAAGLRAAGHDVAVLSGLAPPVADPQLGRGLRVWPSHAASDVGAVHRAKGFGSWLREEWGARQPDAVIATTWCAGAAALVAGGRDRPPVLAAATAPGRDEPTAALQRAVLRGADRVLVPSDEHRTGVLAAGVSRRAVVVLPPGVDVGAFPEAQPRPQDGRVVVVCEGGPEEASGVPALVRALRAAPDVHVRVLGVDPGPDDHPRVAALHELARRAGAAGRVRGLGLVAHAEMPDVLAGADVVAHLPAGGGGGRLVLEAMASARAVLVAGSGPLDDVVADRTSGLVVPPGDALALARALRELAGDPFLRQALGQSGRDRVLARYAWDRVALELHHQLVALVGSGGSPAATASA